MSSSTFARFSAHPDWPAAVEVIRRLGQAGYEAVLAGGAVRDALMGRAIHDLDIATSATPDQIEKIFDRTIPVGKAFGVMVVLMGRASFEVATFRQDGLYRDGRRPETVKYANLTKDAWRRDFTVNALYFSPSEDRIIDVVDGVRDLRNQELKTVGQPDERFREDHLRILRVIRFAAQLGFHIDGPTWSSACRLSSMVREVSVERQISELRKMALSDRPELGWHLLRESGVLDAILPEMMTSIHLKSEKWTEFLKIYAITKGAPIEIQLATWAVLAEISSSHFEVWLRRFHMSQNEVQAGVQFLKVWNVLANTRSKAMERLRALDLDVSPWVVNALMLIGTNQTEGRGLLQSDLRNYVEIMDGGGRLPRPLVSGQDLLGLGLSPGKGMGAMLDDLFERQIIEGLTRDQLIEEARGRILGK